MSLSAGTRLGFYEIVGPLGAGGMGEVYRAHDRKLDRDVAIKILPEALAGDPERIARFEREARTLAALNHPNIAHIHGLEEADGIRALVMELVDGPTLADRIAQGPMPIDEALPIAKQIAEALEAAHEQGIIHRDLKPANIKLRSDGTVRVLDFGLAKSFEKTALPSALTQSPTLPSPAPTLAGVILGTAAYMSPEQARGKAVDKRTDIWAFGCVLFEMLTGKKPFDGETLTDTVAAIVKNEPDWHALPHGTPFLIRSLIARCLRKDSPQRLRDIADGRFQIEEALNDPVGSAAVALPARNHRGWAAWTAAVLFLGAALFFAARPSITSSSGDRFSFPVFPPDGIGTWGPDDNILFGSGTEPIFRVNSAGGTLTPVTVNDASRREGSQRNPQVLPDGHHFLYLDTGSSKDQSGVYAGSMEGKTHKLLIHGNAHAVYADFRLSPDETKLAASLVDPKTNAVEVWLTDLARRSPSRLASGGLVTASVLWSPDGTRLMFRSNRNNGINEFYERSAAGGGNDRLVVSEEVYRAAQIHSLNLVPTDWSPDGRQIMFSAPAPDAFGNDLWLLPVGEAGKPAKFIASPADEMHGNFSPDGRLVAYTSNESGKFDVYVETDPRSDRKWRVSPNGGYEPRWRADGREMYYLAEDRKLMAVSVGAGPSFGIPKPLFQTRVPAGVTANRTHYVPSRDGQRFLVNMALDAVASPITVVVNWTATLKK